MMERKIIPGCEPKYFLGNDIGCSPKDLSKCKWHDWFEASKNELFNLRKRCKKVFVIGLSMGGSLALHLAAHYQVEGVVALAPGLFLKNKFSFFHIAKK